MTDQEDKKGPGRPRKEQVENPVPVEAAPIMDIEPLLAQNKELMTRYEAAMARMELLEKQIAAQPVLPASHTPQPPITAPMAIHVETPDEKTIVKGTFRNLENRDNPTSKFFFGPSTNIKFYKMTNGIAQQTTLAVAKHLTYNCGRSKYEHNLGTDAKTATRENMEALSSEYTPGSGVKEIGIENRCEFTASGGW